MTRVLDTVIIFKGASMLKVMIARLSPRMARLITSRLRYALIINLNRILSAISTLFTSINYLNQMIVLFKLLVDHYYYFAFV